MEQESINTIMLVLVILCGGVFAFLTIGGLIGAIVNSFKTSETFRKVIVVLIGIVILIFLCIVAGNLSSVGNSNDDDYWDNARMHTDNHY